MMSLNYLLATCGEAYQMHTWRVWPVGGSYSVLVEARSMQQASEEGRRLLQLGADRLVSVTQID